MFDEDYGVQSYFGESGDCDFFGDTSMSGGFASGMGEAGFVSEAFAQDSMGGSFFTEASEFDTMGDEFFTEANTNFHRAETHAMGDAASKNGLNSVYGVTPQVKKGEDDIDKNHRPVPMGKYNTTDTKKLVKTVASDASKTGDMDEFLKGRKAAFRRGAGLRHAQDAQGVRFGSNKGDPKK